MVRLGIVVPCYNEQDVLDETARRLGALLDRMVDSGLIARSSAVYFVDDGSRDRTWEIIQRLSADPRMRGIKLTRNRGHQNALFAGLMDAEGDVLISVDADLQDDLNVMEDMLRLHIDGCDIVYGVRADRTTDTWFKRFTAESYYRALGALGVQVVFNHADYRLLSRRTLEALAGFKEVNLFLRGIIPQLGFRTATVEYARGERFAGESKYPLRKMLALALEGVTSFTAAPLRAITGLGFLVCLGSFAMVAWALLARLLTDAAMPGWASTVVPIYFLGGVQLLCLGVIGEYLAKIYMEVKARPRYLIDARAGGAPMALPGSNDGLGHAPPASIRPSSTAVMN
jgi:glycosyltransferase involved in cell wall biosynthesis